MRVVVERTLVKINEIDFHEMNVTLYGKIKPDKKMTASIKERGILQPVLLHLTEHGRYLCIGGERRIRNAVAAGMDHVPAEIRVYDTPEEMVIDLIECNRNREKTEEQINNEVVHLRSALSEQAKQRKDANLRRGADASNAPTGSNEPVGRTDEQIAEKMGLSASEVKRRTVVCDPSYRESFFEQLRELGANEELVEECRRQWVDVHRDLDMDGLKVSAAANKVKTLQQQFRELCPNYKAPKKGKAPVKKKEAKRKSISAALASTLVNYDADTDTFDVLGYLTNESGGVTQECGIFRRGSISAPAFRSDENSDKVVFVSWDEISRGLVRGIVQA